MKNKANGYVIALYATNENREAKNILITSFSLFSFFVTSSFPLFYSLPLSSILS